MVLSLSECVNCIDSMQTSEQTRPAHDRFTVAMFASLEKHMLLLLKFKTNVPTALDFCLFFAHRAFAE